MRCLSLENPDVLEYLDDLDNLEEYDLVVRATMKGASLALLTTFLIGYRYSEKGDAEVASRPGRPPRALVTAPASPIAQLVRAPH